LVDKWRVDELYDELVVGSLEALADAAVWVDRWVVDGIIARLTASLVTVWGHLLRLTHTGHVQAYAATMVLGILGVGWFIAVPQPQAVVSGDAATGQYAVQATAGLGYSYRWDADGDGTYDSEEFGPSRQVNLSLDVGASQEVRFQVKNAFGRTRDGVYRVERPRYSAALSGAHAIPAGELNPAARAQLNTRGSSR
jgi:NADH-quinone oxidoreductase subunit L